MALEIQGEALVARPGDTVLLTVRAPLSAVTAERIHEKVRDRMPGVHVVIVDQVSAAVLYRPDELAEPPVTSPD